MFNRPGIMVPKMMQTSNTTMGMTNLKDSDTFVRSKTLTLHPTLLTPDQGISVDELDAACKRFEDSGVNFKKKLTDGRMKTVAFILDPDNYWIEVIQNEKLKKRANW